jgi:hypothetical protein
MKVQRSKHHNMYRKESGGKDPSILACVLSFMVLSIYSHETRRGDLTQWLRSWAGNRLGVRTVAKRSILPQPGIKLSRPASNQSLSRIRLGRNRERLFNEILFNRWLVRISEVLLRFSMVFFSLFDRMPIY